MVNFFSKIYGLFNQPEVLVQSGRTNEELTRTVDPRIQFDIKGNILFGIRDNRYSNCAVADAMKADKIVVIPEGVEIIGHNSFENLKCVKKVVCPKSLKKIADNAFENCSIEEIEFNPDSNLVEIGERAFRNSNLKYFYTPDSVNILGMEAFSECKYLQELKLNSLLTIIPQNCFFKCTKLSSLYLSNNITHIGEGSFKESGIKEIHFNPNLRIIGYQAFSSTNLNYLKIPNTVEEIGSRAFANISLKEVYLPNSITKMGSDVVTNFKHLTVDNSNILSLFIKSSNHLLNNIAYNNARIEVEVLTLKSSDNYKNGQFYYDYNEYESKPFKFLVDDNNLFKYNDSGQYNKRLDKFILKLKEEEQELKNTLNERNYDYDKQYFKEVELNSTLFPFKNDSINKNDNPYKNIDNQSPDEIKYEIDDDGRIWKNGDLVTPAMQEALEKSGVQLVKKQKPQGVSLVKPNTQK